MEETESLQRDKCECEWPKNKKLTHKQPRSILCAQSTFQKPTKIQNGLLFKSKVQAFLSSS